MLKSIVCRRVEDEALCVQENLRGFTEAAVLKSKAINAPNAEHLGKKELFDQVRKELE